MVKLVITAVTANYPFKTTTYVVDWNADTHITKIVGLRFSLNLHGVLPAEGMAAQFTIGTGLGLQAATQWKKQVVLQT